MCMCVCARTCVVKYADGRAQGVLTRVPCRTGQKLIVCVCVCVCVCVYEQVWVRGDPRMRLFPRFFLALFLLLLIYLYSFPIGFSYIALASWFLSVLAVRLHLSDPPAHPSPPRSAPRGSPS